MLSTIGLWGMAVGAILIFVDRDPFYLWAKKEVPVVETESAVEAPNVEDKRLDKLVESMNAMATAIESNTQVLGSSQGYMRSTIDKMEKKLEYYDVALKNQKPPVIHMPEIKFPTKLEVEIVKAVEVKGALDLQTPQGKRLRMLHQPGVNKPDSPPIPGVHPKGEPVTHKSVKKQIEGLSR